MFLRASLFGRWLARILLLGFAMSAPSAMGEEPSPGSAKGDEDLRVLGSDGPHLLRQYLLEKIHGQYASRRERVATALKSREALRLYQEELRAALLRVIGEMPTMRTPLNARVTGRIDGSECRIEKIVFESRPHFHVTANLYLPQGDGPFPAVLVACGHSQLGKAYEPYQAVGRLLARYGFVALVYDPIGQGERINFHGAPPNAGLQHKLANVNSIPVGRTMVGYHIWDGVRAIDYLLRRDEVDARLPIGMTGNSGGGAQTMYLMAFDDRIGPAAPSCHITTLERNFELGSAGDGCQSPPFAGHAGLDHPDFFTLRAPRPSIILSAEQDYKDIRFTRKTFREAQSSFALMGRPRQVDFFAYDDKHSFSPPRRAKAVEWMRRWLYDDPTTLIREGDVVTLPTEALRVTESGQVLNEFSDALSVAQLNQSRAEELRRRRTALRNLPPSQARREILQHLAIPADLAQMTARITGTIQRDAYRIDKLCLSRKDEPPLAALMFEPLAVDPKLNMLLYVDGRGKSLEAVEEGALGHRATRGQRILTVDLRGWGESLEAPSRIIYAGGDHRPAMFSLHIGQPLLGQRVADVLATAQYLRDTAAPDERVIDLVGVENAGPVVLHAAVLDPHIRHVTVQQSIQSWEYDVVGRPLEMNVISHVVPGSLRAYDLPDLVELLGARIKATGESK